MSKAIRINILFFFFLLLISISVPTQSSISLTISQSGLDFLKNVLVNQALSSLTPLQIPPIQQTLKIPLLGRVNVILSNITIYRVDVPSSVLKPGTSGITIVGSAASCNLSLHWHYSYSSWLLPLQISDSGSASVQVEGMEVGLTLGLETRFGYLNMSLLETGCYVRDIFIQLNGGASWLYQGMVDAFEDQIESAVEYAIVNKLEDGVLKLKSLLQDLPREISIDDIASLNVTFVDDPILCNNSIGFEIDGLFIKTETAPVLNNIHKHSQSLVSCTHLSKMLGVSLDEAVFKSASALYFNAEFMQWTVDKVPDQSLLNTAWWRFIVPQLYKKYPKDDMDLNITLSAPPAVQILPRGIGATVYADLIIDVLEDGNVVPVLCISLVIRGSGSVKTVGNNLAGSLKLDDFSMSLKWSKIGNLHMNLIQPVMWTIIETVFLPYANSRLGKGFPLPIIHGFTLQDAEIIFSNASLTICSDVNFTEQDDLRKSPTYLSKWTPKLM